MTRLLRISFLVLLCSVFLPLGNITSAQTALDYDLPEGGGHFYTQADGKAGATGNGFAVTNDGGAMFWDFFRANGGVQAVGYPVSHRFRWNGYIVQAFQKVIFQWRPESNSVYFVNVLDEMHGRGLDNRLRNDKLVPQEDDWGSDSGLPFAQVQARHMALLDANAAIAAAYYAEPNSMNRNGLPMAKIQTYGDVVVLRAQRKVYQQWLKETPFAKAGQVVTANGGDLGKEMGLYPASTMVPLPVGQAPRGVVAEQSGTPSTSTATPTATPGGPTATPGGPTATPGGQTVTPTPGPSSTPIPGVCNGDETISFDPRIPVVGQEFRIGVTSAKASSNVGLRGPFSPKLQRVDTTSTSTTWVYTAVAEGYGRVDYTFTIGSQVCTANGVTIEEGNGTPFPTRTPTPGPSPTASSNACQGDEEMSFTANPADVGEVVRIEVTSSRASTNVGLSGSFNPKFAESYKGKKGTVWAWTVTPDVAGRHYYDFKINNTTCTNNFFDAVN